MRCCLPTHHGRVSAPGDLLRLIRSSPAGLAAWRGRRTCSGLNVVG